jgi:hypothetical protein
LASLIGQQNKILRYSRLKIRATFSFGCAVGVLKYRVRVHPPKPQK